MKCINRIAETLNEFLNETMNEIMNEILDFSDFLSPIKNLIPQACGLQSSPIGYAAASWRLLRGVITNCPQAGRKKRNVKNDGKEKMTLKVSLNDPTAWFTRLHMVNKKKRKQT